jgi:drug/metabolite transporter (DMT)-like permease
MSVKDFALMVGICLIWAANNIVAKLIISQYGAPPMLFAAARFAIVALATIPWLFPAPRPLWRVMLVGILMGAGTFALFFIGLQTSSPSAAAIVGQLGLPLTTLLSVVMLGEVIHWPRRIGIGLTLIGVLIVMWNPDGLAASSGLIFIAGAAVAGSLGAVLMKQIDGVKPLRLQAWVGWTSLVLMAALSAFMEPGAVGVAIKIGWPFWLGVLFAGVMSSIIAHTVYYGLIQRYEANLIAPLTLMVPLFTIALGVVFTHDSFGVRMALGSAIALSGVLIVALRKSHVGAVRLWLKEWG